MIRAQEQLPVHREQCVDRFADTLVDCLDRLDRRLQNSGMADHIRICKVDDDHVILLRLDRLHQLIRHLIRAHLRLQIVGRDLRRIDKNAVLARIRSLYAAVKEEGDVRVLLRLGDARLRLAVRRQIFAERIGQGNLLECYGLVRDRHIVLGEAYICRLLSAAPALKAGKIIAAERAGDLSRTVRAEIIKDD